MNAPSYYMCMEAFGRVHSKRARSTSLMDSSFTFCVYKCREETLGQPQREWATATSPVDSRLAPYCCCMWFMIYVASIYHYSSLSTCHFTLQVTSHSSRLFIYFSLHRILIHVEMKMSVYVLRKQMDRCLKVSSFIFRVNRLVIPAAKKRCGSFVWSDAPLTSNINVRRIKKPRRNSAQLWSQFWFSRSSKMFKTTLDAIKILSSVVHSLCIIWSG